MKGLILLLCFPFLAASQTVHFDGEKILYEGTIVPTSTSTAKFAEKSRNAMKAAVPKGTIQFIKINEKTVSAKCIILLKTPFQLIRKLHFNLSLAAAEGHYAYRIDNVFITEQQRGAEPTSLTDKELLAGRELTGTAATANEKLLNEIDMQVQKILALLQQALQNQRASSAGRRRFEVDVNSWVSFLRILSGRRLT